MHSLLVSINVGRPRIMEGSDPWVTSFFKTPVTRPVHLRTMNLDGDEQADLTVHGGLDKAVCVYSADHFSAWREELRTPEFGYGSFGENFSITGQDERTVCIGDIYIVGSAIVQVSQPRSPCWKLARRWNRLDLPRLVVKTGRTGWYFRVLREGTVSHGDSIVLIQRSHPELTIANVNRMTYNRHKPVLAE